MRTMEHINGKPLITMIGMVSGMFKFYFLQINNVDVSWIQKLMSAGAVAFVSGAMAAAGGIVIKWGVKYFKEFKRKK